MQPTDPTPPPNPSPPPSRWRRWFGRGEAAEAAPESGGDGAEEPAEEALSEEALARQRAVKWRRYRRRAKEGGLLAFKALVVAALFTFVIFFDRIVFRVLPGERGVKWLAFAGGTVLDRSYSEGLHLVFPWDEFYIYNMRIQELRQETVIYANDGLEIRVLSSIRFRPTRDFLPHLHLDFGPNYVDKVVKPEVISTLRKVLGNFTPEMIYAKDEAGLLRDLGQTLRTDLNSQYFLVDEFLVTELRLPKTIEEAIKSKLTEEQKMLSYRFRLEKEKDERERRIIEAEGIRAFETISGVPILRWRGIEATEKFAESDNAKIILMGTGEGQLPVILNADVPPPAAGSVATERPAGPNFVDGPLPGVGQGQRADLPAASPPPPARPSDRERPRVDEQAESTRSPQPGAPPPEPAPAVDRSDPDRGGAR